MAYNTKSLLRDLEGKIVPQGFDVAADNYRALTGQNLGNNRFGLDGIQWGKTETGLFVPMAVTDEGHVKVQQVGTIETRFSRSVRSAHTGFAVTDTPSWAKGVIVGCRIYGVTGTFGVDEGLKLSLLNRGLFSFGTGTGTISTNVITSTENAPTIIMYPGIEPKSELPFNKVVKTVLTPKITILLNIKGTFEAGEGFDCEVLVKWLP